MSQRLQFIPTLLSGLYSIKGKPIKDQRGFFNRLFCAEEISEIGLKKPIVQMNQTMTRKKGAIRGLHFQNTPYTETKIVTCIKGKVFDVAIDIRKNSPTFLKWHAEELSDSNNVSLYIPDGFAHGFQALTNDCELLYMHSEFYQSAAEDALNVLDPRLSIKWPLEITEISERDSKHPMINIFKGVEIK
jgi:dTDP-4-dehydrorhamnose 3,5-epimerase